MGTTHQPRCLFDILFDLARAHVSLAAVQIEGQPVATKLPTRGGGIGGHAIDRGVAGSVAAV